jgi:beta-lactam-binding protein with PASTA domain
MFSFLHPVSFGRLFLTLLCLFWALPALSRPVSAQTFPFTLDFEQGTLYGWTTTGNAFAFQPTRGDNPTARERGQPSNHQGNYWVGTYEKFQGKRGQNPGDIQGDVPRGSLTSAPFSIPRGRLTFLVGGGDSDQTRVELWAGPSGDIEFMERVNAIGGRNSETMQRVSWDLSPYAGKTGRIRVVDYSSGPWGHINVDDFRFEPPEEITPVIPVRPVRVAVPEVTGASESDAANRLSRNGLEIGRVTRQETSRAEPGIVFRQSPPARRMVARGTAVDLWVVAAERTVVPDLLERPVDSAMQALERARLRAGRIEKRASPQAAESVLQQSPGPGERVPVGTQVHLVVAEPELVVVPRVLDRSLEEARVRLENVRLRVGETDSRVSDAEPGTVVGQNPGPGERVATGSPVDLRVAIAPSVQRVRVPDVTGLFLAKAIRVLEGRQLVPAVAGNGGPVPESGRVVKQDPAGGTVAVPGDVVRLMVSTAGRNIPPGWIAGVVAAAGGIGLALLRTVKRRRRKLGADARLEIVPRAETGVQEIRFDGESRGPEWEIALRSLPDPGEQVIEADGPLIAEKAGDDG